MGMSSAFIVVNPEAKGSPSLLLEEFLSVMKKHGVRTPGDEICGIESMITLKKSCEISDPLYKAKRLPAGTKMLAVYGDNGVIGELLDFVELEEHPYTPDERELLHNFSLILPEYLPYMEILDDNSGMSIIKDIDWETIPVLEQPEPQSTNISTVSRLRAISFQPAGAADIMVTVEYMADELKPDLVRCDFWLRYKDSKEKVHVLASAMPKMESHDEQEQAILKAVNDDLLLKKEIVNLLSKFAGGPADGFNPLNSIPYKWDRPSKPPVVDQEFVMDERPVHVQILRPADNKENDQSRVEACYSMQGRVKLEWHDKPIVVTLYATVEQAGENSCNMDDVPVQFVYAVNVYFKYDDYPDLNWIMSEYGDIRKWRSATPYKAIAEHYMFQVMESTIDFNLECSMEDENARQAAVYALEDSSPEGQANAFRRYPE